MDIERQGGKVLNYIGCLPWGMHSLPCVRRQCQLCSLPVALQERNVEPTKGFVVICIACLAELFPDSFAHPKAMVGGKLYDNTTEACAAAYGEMLRN